MRHREIYEKYYKGVIMDVTDAKQAEIAEEAGAVAIMALERVPADIRAQGGVARSASIKKIREIKDSVKIPVMAKVRIGHYEEAIVLEELGIDFIDESEVLTPADEEYHINKKEFTTPFVCGARDLGEALRRIDEGAVMIRTKGEAGTGDVNQAVMHMRKMREEIAELVGLYELGYEYKGKGIKNMDDELKTRAQKYGVPFELVEEVGELRRIPVTNYAAGGIATPQDAAYMMKLGVDGVFVGSGIFKSEDPEERAKAIVTAVKNWDNPSKVLEASEYLKEGMRGISTASLKEKEKMQYRGK